MAILVRSQAVERGLARHFERRSPQAGESSVLSAESSVTSVPSKTPALATTAASAAPSSSQMPVSMPPDSVKALAGAIVVFGLIVLGFAAWKIRSWRRKKVSFTEKSDSEKGDRSSIGSFEKHVRLQIPRKVLVLPTAAPDSDTSVGWVPQVAPWVLQDKPTPYASAALTDSKSAYPNAPTLDYASKDKSFEDSGETEQEVSPPPTYFVSTADTQASPPSAPTTPDFPVTPRAVSPQAQAPIGTLPVPPVPAIKTDFVQSDYGLPIEVVRSPTRTVSAAPKNAKSNPKSKWSVDSHASIFAQKSVRKKTRTCLVTVVATYKPSQSDELPIRVGETYRLLEEFEDGWCRVQQVGGQNPETGVIPRFCVEERPDFITTHSQNQSLLIPVRPGSKPSLKP